MALKCVVNVLLLSRFLLDIKLPRLSLMRYIDVNDSEAVLRAIRLCAPECPIDMIVHTPGGLVLAADEIVMDENAVLGPVDPQVGQSPASPILSVLEHKEPKDIDDQTFISADIARKAVAQMRATVRELLSERLSGERASALAEKLTSGTWTHDYPITAQEAKAMGLPVTTEMSSEIYQLMSFFL